jgi:hypothetical protein
MLVGDPLEASSAIQAMAFRALDTPLGDLLTSATGLLDLIGTVQLDTWGGQERIKMLIEDARLHQAVVSYAASA